MHNPKHDPSPETGVFIAFVLTAVSLVAFAIVYCWLLLAWLFN